MSRVGKLAILLILSSLSLNAVAGNMLASICNASGGVLYKNKRISFYTASNIWPQGSQSDVPAVQITFDKMTLGIYSEARVDGGGNLGIQDFARTMTLLGEPVDICGKNGYLIGLENTTGY